MAAWPRQPALGEWVIGYDLIRPFALPSGKALLRHVGESPYPCLRARPPRVATEIAAYRWPFRVRANRVLERLRSAVPQPDAPDVLVRLSLAERRAGRR